LKVCITDSFTQKGRKFILIQYLPETCCPVTVDTCVFVLFAHRKSFHPMASVHGTLYAPPTHRLAGRIKHRLKRKVTSACSSKWL